MTLPELQSQIDRACEILKIASRAQRERLLANLSALLRAKRQMLGDVPYNRDSYTKLPPL